MDVIACVNLVVHKTATISNSWEEMYLSLKTKFFLKHDTWARKEKINKSEHIKFRNFLWQNTTNKVKIRIANWKSYDRWKTNFINLQRRQKIKYKIEQNIQEGNSQENKNKWLNKRKHANLIHFEQIQYKTKVYNIFPAIISKVFIILTVNGHMEGKLFL